MKKFLMPLLIAAAILISINMVIPNYSDSKKNKNNEGFLLTNMSAKYINYMVDSEPGVSIVFYSHNPKNKRNYELYILKNELKVINLPEGDYSISSLRFGNFITGEKYIDLKKQAKFKIEKNKISYIGDLVFEVTELKNQHYLKINVADNDPKTIDEFKSQYPLLSSNSEIRKEIVEINLR